MGALALAVALFLSGPMMAVARAAARPLDYADMMRAIHVTLGRKIDPTEKGLFAAPPPLPTEVLNTTSEPTEPQKAPAPWDPPRLWTSRARARKRRR
jgi:hypothetical protein